MTMPPRRPGRNEPYIGGNDDDFDEQETGAPLIIDDAVADADDYDDSDYDDSYDDDDDADEYVIGADTPPPASPRNLRTVSPPPIEEDDWETDDDEYDEWDDYADDDGYDDDYDGPLAAAGDDRGYRRAAAYSSGGDGSNGTRLGIIIAVVAVVAIAALAILWFAVSALTGDDDADSNGTTTAVESDGVRFDLRIDSPGDGDRVEIEEPVEVRARAIADEAIVSFVLLLDGEPIDDFAVLDPKANREEAAVFRVRIDDRGEHELIVEVHSSSGAVQRTEPVRITAIEPVTGTPGTLIGRVIADVTAREQPEDSADAVGRITAGDEVTVTGRTRDSNWLQVNHEIGTGIWVRRTGIELDQSINGVPVRETETATPTPTETIEEESATPTPTETAAPETTVDLIPAGAELTDDGSSLIVYIQNAGAGSFAGAVVVSVGGVGASSEALAFDVTIGPGETGSVIFALSSPLSSETSAEVTVDPDEAVTETSEGNNYASFYIAPVAVPASLSVQSANLSGDTIIVLVGNSSSGGALGTSEVTVSISLNGVESSRSQTLALDPGGTAEFFVPAPEGTGTATVTVFVDGTPAYTAEVIIPESDE